VTRRFTDPYMTMINVKESRMNRNTKKGRRASTVYCKCVKHVTSNDVRGRAVFFYNEVVFSDLFLITQNWIRNSFVSVSRIKSSQRSERQKIKYILFSNT